MPARRLGYTGSILFVMALAVAGVGIASARAAESPQRVVRVGLVSPNSPASDFRGIDEFWGRLRELGWVEGQNMVVEKRWADNRMERLPGLMAEVVGNNVDVLVSYSTPAVLAARNATRTVPIVGVGMGDPFGAGLAVSLARPGGNVTGLYMGFADVAQKWLELLQETIPRLSTVVLMSNRDVPVSVRVAKELTAVAPKFRVKIRVLDVPGPEEFNDAFKQARDHAQAVIVLPDPVSLGHRKQVIALAAQYRLPTFYFARDFVEAGGLMAYAADSVAMFRRAAEYVDKILRGAKAAELPIEQPNKFELIVNLRTAKALGITIPQSILLRADDVIR